MKKLLCLCVLALYGCASTETELLSSTPSTVVVKAKSKNANEAQTFADKECRKVGKTAKLNQFVPANKVWGSYFFDCQ